jgi:DinB superfamily
MSVFTNPASSSVEQAREYVSAVLGLVDGQEPVDVLERTPPTLSQVTGGLTAEQLKRPEAPGKWSMNQVLQHLADSELVWSFRLRMVLAHDRPSIAGYDQDLWATRLGYADGDPKEAVERFSSLRRTNLALLMSLTPAELKRVGVHSERGEESVEHMIRLYAGHDLLHLRQLERVRGVVV